MPGLSPQAGLDWLISLDWVTEALVSLVTHTCPTVIMDEQRKYFPTVHQTTVSETEVSCVRGEVFLMDSCQLCGSQPASGLSKAAVEFYLRHKLLSLFRKPKVCFSPVLSHRQYLAFFFFSVLTLS